jgi:hypothetical protein
MEIEAVHLLPAIILLYVGPDQTMPIVSYLATIVGLLLLLGNRVLAGLRWLFNKLKGR